MRTTTNEKLIARQVKIARYTTFGSLGILLGSLVIVNISNANYIAFAYATLLVGFMLAYVGSTLGNAWIKEPRADHALERALKGFDNKHHLYNFLLPAAHVLVTPLGVLVFLVKNQDGAITCQNGKWNRKWHWGRLIGGMGQAALGDPIRELDRDVTKMKEFITSQVANGALVPVDGYVVFSDPRVKLDVDDAALPVVRADDLKETLRKVKRGAPLANELQNKLASVLDETANGKTTQQ
ncbi:MAG: NERD domain-containing protein [Chloroflexi bacterium]|nr:NERD domain-containing protein [Chloroflexota bacterium]